jgi:hypothetical protein
VQGVRGKARCQRKVVSPSCKGRGNFALTVGGRATSRSRPPVRPDCSYPPLTLAESRASRLRRIKLARPKCGPTRRLCRCRGRTRLNVGLGTRHDTGGAARPRRGSSQGLALNRRLRLFVIRPIVGSPKWASVGSKVRLGRMDDAHPLDAPQLALASVPHVSLKSKKTSPSVRPACNTLFLLG